jgi:hypothetical protein
LNIYQKGTISFAYYSAQRTNLENFSAQILRLD